MVERQGSAKLGFRSDSTRSVFDWYEYQSDFAKRYVAQGCAAGERSGRAALLIRLLAMRFGPLTDVMQARIAEASIAELDAIGERLLTAQTLHEAMGPH